MVKHSYMIKTVKRNRTRTAVELLDYQQVIRGGIIGNLSHGTVRKRNWQRNAQKKMVDGIEN